MKEIKDCLIGLGVIVIVYIVVAWFAFQARNELCNESVFFIHFVDVVRYEKLEKFQSN